MIIALLENPDSGQGKAGDVADLLRGHGAEVHCFDFTEADPADISECAADRIVIAGGDGSIGLAAGLASATGLPLGVVPVGTANDFARAIRLPDDLEEACELVAGESSLRRLDLARINDRDFVNVASAGLAPAAAENAEDSKESLGKFAYGVGAAQAAAAEDPLTCTVTADGEQVFDGECWQVMVASSGAFGGGSEIEAEPADEMLDLVVIEAGSKLRLVRHAVGLRIGKVEDQPGVTSVRACEIDISAPAGTTYNVDGEVVEIGSAEFNIAGNFEVIVGG